MTTTEQFDELSAIDIENAGGFVADAYRRVDAVLCRCSLNSPGSLLVHCVTGLSSFDHSLLQREIV
jgi:hypothetical protein